MAAMWKLLRRFFSDRADGAASDCSGMQTNDPVPGVEQSTSAAPPRTVRIPGPTQIYEKDLSSPFWAAVAKMQPGSYVAYESVGREWHVFRVEQGPEYGRPEVLGDVSVVVRRVTTGARFTMPASRLTPCESGFVSRDGTRIRKGEGYRF
jgi:hypothetical protein